LRILKGDSMSNATQILNRKSLWKRGFFLVAILLLGSVLLVNFQLIRIKWQSFATIFLGIFIEAFPFLLLGTFASGLVEVYLPKEKLGKLFSHSPILNALLGGMLGLLFPVCECGIVPLVRRLLSKDVPAPAAIAFLLSAPIINPIVIISTATAFGVGKILFLRIGIAVAIAIITGLVFSTVGNANDLLNSNAEFNETCCGLDHADEDAHHQFHLSDGNKPGFPTVLQITFNELFEIGRYLIFGALLASAMQVFVPQSILVALSQGPVSSILTMILMAVVLSVCSTVDSFIALGFVGIFNTASILAFLIFGPMVDIKSSILFLRVFKPRVVFYIISIPFLLVLISTLILGYLGV
jgi:uncharacterized protein